MRGQSEDKLLAVFTNTVLRRLNQHRPRYHSCVVDTKYRQILVILLDLGSKAGDPDLALYETAGPFRSTLGEGHGKRNQELKSLVEFQM